ncbi:MAG: MFS transporter [Rhizobiaceae bacterium]|nr:MFS transporter [Rhizobiaceae bacterium]
MRALGRHSRFTPHVGGGLLALGVLFLARISVSFQFQSVAPLSGLLEERFDVSLSRLGLLLGIYMAPGIVVALCLPSVISRFGRTRVICLAIMLMAAGEALLWQSGMFGTALASRLIAGAGGCVIYIITINMVADLHTGISAPARMGIIAAAWPFGNAFALGMLGWMAVSSPEIASHAPLALALAALVATSALLMARTQAFPSPPTPSFSKWKDVLVRIWPAALSFSLYNIAFIILTGFAGRILVDDGVPTAQASAIAAVPMWFFLVSVPLGGFIAGRSNRGDFRIVCLSCLLAAAAVLASATGSHHLLLYSIAGLLGGLPTAPMLARGRMASGADTDISYSALFAIFFVALIVLPPAAGRLADFTGTSHTILGVVAALLAASILLFGHALRRPPQTA